jgi:nitroimidazol reductase NimA-like FMN-containing flavoprotein (pyridoxamine 5'-phosphate oxidase superfamily)
MLRSLASGIDVCLTVTLVDGLVLGRSVFHQSINYRSVVILGKARAITEATEKMEALRILTNHVVPGQWEEARIPNEKELAATSVLTLPINEASAKIRSGPPPDAEEEWDLPVWAGVLPLWMKAGDPVPDDHVLQGLAPLDKHRFARFLRD